MVPLTELDSTRFRACCICGVTYPRTPQFFERRSAKPHGVGYRCRVCAKNARREWRTANPDYQREWREAHPGYAAERLAEWQAANKERMAEHYAAYYQRNRVARDAKDRNRRALRMQAEGTHGLRELQQMHEDQGGLCAYCETPLNNGYDVDHMIPLVRGGCNDWTNLALACATCNRRKGSMTAEEFVEGRLG